MGRQLRVLVVEDLPDDAELIILALRKGGFDVAWERAQTADELEAALAVGDWDAVVSDYNMPGFDVETALRLARAADPDLPFVVVSGSVGDDVAVGMMRAGANDYVLKHNLVRLAPALDREVRTARNRRAKRASERATAHLAAVVNSSADAIISKTLDGIVTSWNPAAERLHGWTADEAIGRHISFIVPLDKADEFAGVMGRLRRGKHFEQFETVRLHRDSTRHDVSITASPISDSDGQLVGVSKVARYIGEWKRRDVELRESEQRFRQQSQVLQSILDNMSDGVVVADETGKFLLFNPAAEQILQLGSIDARPEEWQQRYSLFLPPDGLLPFPTADNPMVRAMRGEACDAVEMIVKHDRIPEAQWISVNARPMRDAAGDLRGGITVFRNITEQKRAEKKLRLFRALIDKTSDGIEVIDLETGRFLDVNERSCLAHGYTREEFLKMSVADIDPSITGRSWAAMINEGRFAKPQLFESTHQRKDGSIFPVEVSHDTIELNREYLVAVVRDITERKKAEDAMQASEERFRAFMDHSPAAADIKDEEGRFLYVNAAWRRQFGPEPINDWQGKTNFDFWPRETADMFRSSDLDCLARNAAIQMDETFRTPAGDELTKLVMKFPLFNGRRRVIGGMAWDITDRKRAEDTLRLRDRAIQAASQGFMITDPGKVGNPIMYASPGFERITGYGHKEVLGHNCRFLQGKDTDPEAVAQLRAAVQAGEPCTVEILNYRKDGVPFWNEVSISPIRDAAGRLTHFVGVQADVTTRRDLAEQLRQSQKMEAVGQLAGGVAHDFNNLLTIINGYSDLLLQSLPPGDSSRELLIEIHEAGERSAGLTRQLLAFSRKQVLAPRVLDLNIVVIDAEKMLRRMIGEDMRLTTMLGTELGAVRADPGQLEQVLLNLAVNARDAMPIGGRLTIETSNFELDEEFAQAHPGTSAGSHVLMTVSDTGCGMTPEVMARVFEPYFTTKGPGKGTGLGLATVFGIVQQSGGTVDMVSEIGVGTAFKMYFPRVEMVVVASGSRLGLGAPPPGTETILLVEDEDGVRALTRYVLERCGYTVLEAVDGEEAMRVAAEHEGPIHILITDVVMPGVGGRVVAEQVAAGRPETRVLFVSGYTDDAVVRHGVLCEQVNFLQKPFSPVGLAHKVRQVLDASPVTQPQTG